VYLSNTAQTYTGSSLAATVTTNPAGLATTVTYGGSSTPPTAPGSYLIVAIITDPNYSGNTRGVLQINQETAGVTLGNLSHTYNGSPQAATATTNPAGLPVVITYNGSTTPPTAVGTYGVTATINSPDYKGSVSGVLTIGKIAATVYLSNTTQTYTGAPLAVTATTSPSGLATTVTYNGSSTPPTAPGSYLVVATITDPNYSGNTRGVLVIR
jgi:hypothetical protein